MCIEKNTVVVIGRQETKFFEYDKKRQKETKPCTLSKQLQIFSYAIRQYIKNVFNPNFNVTYLYFS